MSDIKSQLEAKRQRLDQLKKCRSSTTKPDSNSNITTPPKSDALSQQREEVTKILSDIGMLSPEAESSDASKSPTPLEIQTNIGNFTKTHSRHSKLPSCNVTILNGVNILPKESVNYDKIIQTDESYAENQNQDSLPSSPIHPETFDLPETTTSATGIGDNESERPQTLPTGLHKLTPEQEAAIVNSDSFLSFFDWSTRVMERALGETKRCDIFRDYSGKDQLDEVPVKDKVSFSREFIDERWTANRVVTSLDWSCTYPEMLLSSYFTNEEKPNEPDGVVAVWNINYEKTSPEFIFHCQSPVLSAKFATFHPNLIIGGCYSGQIVLWDNRTHKRTPVQKSAFSSKSHVYPVYCLDVIGSQNAHNLISISKDGKLCSWSLDNLSQPQYSIDIEKPALQVMGMSFPTNDMNRIFVCTEEKCAYQIVRHGTTQGVSATFEGHIGPVLGIDCHHVSSSQFDFSSYFLTSSADWSVILWDARQTETKDKCSPLHVFPHGTDYIWDVEWSPVHPSVFASIDGSGYLYLWNLNQDIEVPKAKEYVGTPLNCIKFHQDGRCLALGDETGKVHICNLTESFFNPGQDEWSKLQKNIDEMQKVDLKLTSNDLQLSQ